MAKILNLSQNSDQELLKKIKENSDTSKIIYDLTMPINEEITPLKNFIEKMDSLKLAVLNHKFLQQILQFKRF